MNKKALIALLAVVVVALGGGLYYRQYMETNEAPPNLQATGLYQGSTSEKQSGFLKAEKSQVGSKFEQTKKDKDGKDSKDKASLKFAKDAGGLSDVYSETDTDFEEVMENFKAKKEGQEFMIGQYETKNGKWTTTKQSYYAVKYTSTVKNDLDEVEIPAGKAFVFVSNADADLYGYKDTSEEPEEDYDFCRNGEKGWNAGVVTKNGLFDSVEDCLDNVVSVWVKVRNAPLNDKYKKIYSSNGSEKDLKSYKMKDFYMVWVKLAEDSDEEKVPPTDKEKKGTTNIGEDTGILGVSNLQVTGSAVNADNTVSLDETKELGFRWLPTYDSKTVTQYTDTKQKEQALSYTWTIKDSAGKTAWELIQSYGKGTEGVTKDDAQCFVQLYDVSGKALDSGKDWICNYTSLPGGIKFVADTKYTFEVTVSDGKKVAKSSVSFTTEKAAVAEPVAVVDDLKPTAVAGDTKVTIIPNVSTEDAKFSGIKVVATATGETELSQTLVYDAKPGVVSYTADASSKQISWVVATKAIEITGLKNEKEYTFKIELLYKTGFKSTVGVKEVKATPKAAVVEPVAVVDALNPVATAGIGLVTITPNITTEDAKFSGVEVVATATGETELSQTLVYDAKPGVVSYTADASSKQIKWIVATKAIEITGLKSEKEYTFKIKLLYKSGFKSTVGVKEVKVVTSNIEKIENQGWASISAGSPGIIGTYKITASKDVTLKGITVTVTKGSEALESLDQTSFSFLQGGVPITVDGYILKKGENTLQVYSKAKANAVVDTVINTTWAITLADGNTLNHADGLVTTAKIVKAEGGASIFGVLDVIFDLFR